MAPTLISIYLPQRAKHRTNAKWEVRPRKLKDLRAKNYNGTEGEWADILRYVLVSKDKGASMSEDEKKGLEVVADVSGHDPNRNLTIILRNRIGDITQRLGSIVFTQTDDEIQLFDWTCQVLDKNASLEAENTTLKAQSQSYQATVSSLQAQLADLVEAKAEHEDQLISKFVLLLNEKKLKVRKQQNLLKTATVDKKRLEQLQTATGGKGRRSKSSRTGKRRADASPEVSGGLSESSDGFQSMDIDPKPNKLQQEADSDRRTTATDTESEDEAASAVQSSTSLPGPELANSPTPEPARIVVESRSPPPKRTLPFTRKKVEEQKKIEEALKKPPEPASGSDEETASDDDEL